MGMDVYGKKPTEPVGEYFRRNVWGWHPLWDCVEALQPEIAGLVKNAHSNSGGGLKAADSIKLAELLRADLDNGRVDEYVAERGRRLAELPRKDCEYCGATGIRTDAVGVERKMPEFVLEPAQAILLGRSAGWCNGCQGEGKTDAWETNYYLDRDDVAEFAQFLAKCGGFKIC
jgi:hypothetical protein